MAYNRIQAKKALTAQEYELFELSLGDRIDGLDPAALRNAIARTRRLRDKQRDLLQRQRLASREASGSKGGKTGLANVRTAQKAQMLDEALVRFEKRSAVLSARADAAARRASARRAAESRKASKAAGKPVRSKPGKRTGKPHGPQREVSAKATQSLPKAGPALPGKKRQMGRQRTRAMLGRVSAAGRRNQGRRDSR
jgi:hypothetical protein